MYKNNLNQITDQKYNLGISIQCKRITPSTDESRWYISFGRINYLDFLRAIKQDGVKDSDGMILALGPDSNPRNTQRFVINLFLAIQ